MEGEYPPQVLLRNIPRGYTHVFVMETITEMMKAGYSKGIVDPTRIIVRTDHAFLHFVEPYDAVKAQEHLHNYKFLHAILSAQLLLNDADKWDMEQHIVDKGEQESNVPSDKEFPVPEVKPIEEKNVDKGFKGSAQCDILSSILNGLEGCDDIMEEEKPVKAQKPTTYFCVECGNNRTHTLAECPNLRQKTRHSTCSYCKKVGHILFAKYPDKKVLVCPVAIARGSAFKYYY